MLQNRTGRNKGIRLNNTDFIYSQSREKLHSGLFWSLQGSPTIYMSVHRARLRPLIIPDRKDVDFESPPSLTHGGGHLSPDLQPSTPPTFPDGLDPCSDSSVSRIGEYLLLEAIDCNGPIHIYHALHTITYQKYICKVRIVFINYNIINYSYFAYIT